MDTSMKAPADNFSDQALEGGTRSEETQQKQIEQLEIEIQEQRRELERLHKQLEEEIAERQLWAQHLHDAINQSLFSAGLIAEVLLRLWEKDQTAARRSLEELRRLTFGAMAEGAPGRITTYDAG